jgi:hypothetical protein
MEKGVPNRNGKFNWRSPYGGQYALDENMLFAEYSPHSMFELIPEFRIRLGEASSTTGKYGYRKLYLTSPKVDA